MTVWLALCWSAWSADLARPNTERLDRTAGELATQLGADPALVRARLGKAVADNLAAKGDLELSPDEIGRTVVDYEAFKLGTYVSAGVFPKRYFGYFDLRHDTVDAEWTLREVTDCTVRLINAHQESTGSPVRVSAAEIAVTFIAEGGALLLREDQHRMDALDPIMDVGLDDIASGSKALPGLLDAFDRECGTAFDTLIVRTPAGSAPPEGALMRADVAGREYPTEWSWRMRDMTFIEGIAGTAFMWIWEKELAAEALKSASRTPIHERDLAEQFILGSLVYNSGLIHAESTMARIKAFQTGAYLHDASERNAKRRWRLNLAPPKTLLAEQLAGEPYRPQWTSWNAAYHITQRYGAWEALRRFTSVFDASGAFTPRHRPPPPVEPEPEPQPEPELEARGCGCATGEGSGVWWIAVLGLLTRAARTRPGARTSPSGSRPARRSR